MSLFSSRPRSRVAVVLLSILMVPLGMLYLGRPVRAGVYLGLTILSVPVACLLAIGGVWPAGVSFAVPGYAVALVGIADAWRIAGQFREKFTGSWYTSWQGLAGVTVAAVAAILLFRALAFEPFRMPSEAMLPTLHRGDQIFVSKSVYGLRLPFTSRTVAFERDPARGDVVVFRVEAEGVNYLKRIIGLPGDPRPGRAGLVEHGRARASRNAALISATPRPADQADSSHIAFIDNIDMRN